MSPLARRIRKHRQAAGLTATAAAERAGLHRVAWAELEAGRNDNPKLNTLEKVAGALGVTVAELLTDGDGESVSVAPVVNHRHALELLAGGGRLSAKPSMLPPHASPAVVCYRFDTGEVVGLPAIDGLLAQDRIKLEQRGGNPESGWYVITEKGQEFLDEDGESVTIDS